VKWRTAAQGAGRGKNRTSPRGNVRSIKKTKPLRKFLFGIVGHVNFRRPNVFDFDGGGSVNLHRIHVAELRLAG
jgi:hypothetical protein